MKIKNLRGELTTQQIVLLIILITSFVIILFFFFRLNLGEDTDKELCRNSVVLKGSSVFPSGSISLNCYRNYECLTEDGTCEGITSPEVEKVDNLDDIYQKLAEDMASCWWMFGEGKIDYIGEGFTKNNYCSICSQILFDDSLKNIKGVEDGKISKDQLYDYLATTEMPGKDIKYAEYFFGTNDIESLKSQFLAKTGVGTFGTIELEKQYFVVMGITNEISGWVSAGAVVGGVLGVVIAIFTPVGLVGGAIIVGGSIIGGVAAGTAGEEIVEDIKPEIIALMVEGRGIDNQFMAPTILEADSEKFKELNCEEIITFT